MTERIYVITDRNGILYCIYKEYETAKADWLKMPKGDYNLETQYFNGIFYTIYEVERN